jgi:putative MATE family efflux protein
MSVTTAAGAMPIPRANPLLSGRILPTLVRLSLPNVLAMAATVVVGIAEMSYIGILGTEPLAAMALVFPFAMLTQMMSAGAMGGGVSSAVSRALGAGDVLRARALALHAVAIGAIAGLLYSVFFLMFGPALYRFLGGSGPVLAEAVPYSNVLFSGALLIWLSNTLASVLRGTGNMRLPSVTILAASALQIVLGGSLGLGLGPLPRLGMPGVALGQLIATGTAVAVLLWYLRSGQGRLRLQFRGIAFRREMFFDILKVGALACLSPVQSILTVLIFTALVARFGVPALAGYGIGARLEFLLIPIAFGVGVATVPMVGMAIGAGDVARARRVARTAGGVSALMLGLIGLVVATAPELWAGLFSREEAVLLAASQYLRLAGPAFAFFGLGLTLYFAAQGSGNVLGPVLASTLRLLLVAAGGPWLAQSGAGVAALFALVGVSMTVYGVATATALFFTRWGVAPTGATALAKA